MSSRPRSGAHDEPRLRATLSVPLGTLRTVANGVTLVRTIGSVTVGTVAIVAERPVLLAVAYAIYWLGDSLDGLLARTLHQETRLGAVFDIVSDRACASLLCAGVIAYRPELAVAVIPFFLSFMVLDTLVSLSFLCWPLVSPNYFAQVDPLVFKLNWSHPAKALNSAAVMILALVGLVWVSLALVIVLIGVKAWSGLRILRLLEGPPETPR